MVILGLPPRDGETYKGSDISEEIAGSECHQASEGSPAGYGMIVKCEISKTIVQSPMWQMALKVFVPD